MTKPSMTNEALHRRSPKIVTISLDPQHHFPLVSEVVIS
jgi:hypothetical protein